MPSVRVYQPFRHDGASALVNNKKDNREAKLRVARMEAHTALRENQLGRRKRDNMIAVGAAAVAIIVAGTLAMTVFAGPKDDADASASASATSSASATATASPTSTAAQTNSPTVAKITDADKKVLTGTLTLNGSPLGVEIDGTKAPQAAAVFRQLTAEGFFKGKTCHRLTNSTDFDLIQCGSLKGDGAGDPSYQWGPVENSPKDGVYPAGSIAMARANTTYTNGTQFFITYKDTKLPQDTGGYGLVGKVTSGLDVITKIAAGGISGAAGTTDGAPKTKVTIDSFTLK